MLRCSATRESDLQNITEVIVWLVQLISLTLNDCKSNKQSIVWRQVLCPDYLRGGRTDKVEGELKEEEEEEQGEVEREGDGGVKV